MDERFTADGWQSRAVSRETESGDKMVVVWSSAFEPNGTSDDEAASIVGGISETGLEAVRHRISRDLPKGLPHY